MKSRRVMLMVEVETDETIKDLKRIAKEVFSPITVIQVQANVIKKEKK